MTAAAVALAPTARAHGVAVGERPTTYTSAVRMIRDELGGIERSRRSGDLVDVSLRSVRLGMLADSSAAFVDTLASTRADSSRSVLVAAAAGIRAASIELHDAADRRDSVAVATLTPRFASGYQLLDSRVLKQYVCPMHCEPGKIYDRPGNCPVCDMMLQLITSDRYSVSVESGGKPLRAGKQVTLDFQVRDPAGFDAKNLQVVHEKLMHLMIVSQDLSWFDHVHPVPDSGGHFRMRYKFPRGGTYTLYHDFTPDRVGMQVVPVELGVDGRQPPPVPLVIDRELSRHIDGYEVVLTHTALGVDVDCAMRFTLMHGGEPVTDLEPFLGAMGHLVMISADRGSYVHSHPLDASGSTGPSVQFNMTFSRTGTYKAWGQFQRRGKVLTVPFVVEVTPDGHTDTHPPGNSAK